MVLGQQNLDMKKANCRRRAPRPETHTKLHIPGMGVTLAPITAVTLGGDWFSSGLRNAKGLGRDGRGVAARRSSRYFAAEASPSRAWIHGGHGTQAEVAGEVAPD